jgi:hypothetical protein
MTVRAQPILPRVSGHTTYRSVIPTEHKPEDHNHRRMC